MPSREEFYAELFTLHQRLVSGDLAAWAEASGFDGPAVGAFGLAEGIRYSVRLARDRLLAVSTKVHTPYRLEVSAAYFAALLTLEWVAAAVLLLFWLAKGR